jgi:hypothetical protein
VTLHPLSQACVFIYSSHGKWVFPALLWSFPPTTTFTSFPAPGCWVVCCCSCRLACLFTAHIGGGSSPLSCGVFLPPPLSQVFPLLVAGTRPRSRQSLSDQAQLVYLQFREGFPSPPLQSSGCPTLFATCLYYSYCSLLLLYCSLFSPGGGQSVQGATLI